MRQSSHLRSTSHGFEVAARRNKTDQSIIHISTPPNGHWTDQGFGIHDHRNAPSRGQKSEMSFERLTFVPTDSASRVFGLSVVLGDYTVVATGKGRPALKCSLCGEIFPMQSNLAIAEELLRTRPACGA
jgi:hypothetical protein